MNLFNVEDEEDLDLLEFSKKQFANKFYSSLHDH